MHFKQFLLTALVLSATAQAAEPVFPMVDPKLDDPAKPWCYFANPVTCIGTPWMPEAVQVTPEGNIFTGQAELCFFWGDDLAPLQSRQRHFLDGWIPIVQDSWTRDGLKYDYEAFGTTLDGFDESNTLQFARLTITNTTDHPATARAAIATRQNGGPNRMRATKFNADQTYDIQDSRLLAGGRVICEYAPSSSFESVSGETFAGPFAARDLHISARTEVGLARYEKTLLPGESWAVSAKLPRVPVDAKDAEYLRAMRDADVETYRKKTIDYWTRAFGERSRIHTPGEPLIEQAHRATAVHTMLATRTYDGTRTQTDGLPYPQLFISAIYDYGMLYDSLGANDLLEPNIPLCLQRQEPDGLYVDTSVSHGQKILCAHGQTLAFLSNHVLAKRDTELGKKLFPSIRRAVDCIRKDHQTQPHGLMRPSIPYDNEMIKGQFTSHNYWALIGLRSAIRLADFLGEKEISKDWRVLHDDFEKTLLLALKESAAEDHYVPTGLYGFITGEAARKGFAEYRTDQDWENMMLLWPTELVAPSDPLVAGTLARLRDTKYREGILTYRNGQHLHQYITTRAANQYIAMGNQREALIDVYHILLHSGSAFESFENMIRPWTDRDVEGCPPPHAWGCANVANTLRNLFVMELGGHGGIDPQDRDIYLFNAISPTWLVESKPLGIENAPTSFGNITALLTPRAGGADISIKTDFHTQPRLLAIRVPYFVTITGWKSDGEWLSETRDAIYISPTTTKLSIDWTINSHADDGLLQELLLRHRTERGFWDGKRADAPPRATAALTPDESAITSGPLSFATVLQAWKIEYARRYAEHVRSARPTKDYHPVRRQAAADRN